MLEEKRELKTEASHLQNTQVEKRIEKTAPFFRDTRTVLVKKTDVAEELLHPGEIYEKLLRLSHGLPDCNLEKLTEKIWTGLFNGILAEEFEELVIQTAASFISEDPQYSRLAARLLDLNIVREMVSQKIYRFAESIETCFQNGIVGSETHRFVTEDPDFFDSLIKKERSQDFEYFGLRTVYDRYLLKHPETRKVVETPQYFFLRVACGLAETKEEASEIYHLISQFDFMFSTPTLFNSGTKRPQLSSCFLLDSPQDDLMAIYDRYKDIAKLSKFAGGIGVAFHRIRSKGSLIKGTNGKSNGIVPWLKTLDSSVAAVNQGGKRKGACCAYLETWHADIEEFLELRNNTGDESRRTHNINVANWIPDLFMRRVEEGGIWSLFDPKECPEFPDLYGAAFEEAYLKAESEGRFSKQIDARTLYAKMMKTLAETGNGWINFKDASNQKCNQTKNPKNVVHLSNLCTEILEITSEEETAVCNLGSINLAKHVQKEAFDFEKLKKTVRLAVRYLDRVIDKNYYPVEIAKSSNQRWRPVGLGIMGLQDVFFKLGLPYDSKEALELSSRIQEEIYYEALFTSSLLAEENGPHLAFKETRASEGKLQFDLWGVTPRDSARWDVLKKRIQRVGLRNSLLIAIAPTATIASIVGSYEAMEPQVSNLFKRETLSGEFLQVNKYLVEALKSEGLWTKEIKDRLVSSEGSIQEISEIPERIRKTYRTAWELSMKSLIDLAAGRGPFIDQSQSLNLFIENPTIGKVSSMYMYAWKKGIKTTYYLRSRAATRIQKTTAHSQKKFNATEAVVCSLENPEACEACQ